MNTTRADISKNQFVHKAGVPKQDDRALKGHAGRMKANIKSKLVHRNYTPIKAHPIQGLNNQKTDNKLPFSPGGHSTGGNDVYLS